MMLYRRRKHGWKKFKVKLGDGNKFNRTHVREQYCKFSKLWKKLAIYSKYSQWKKMNMTINPTKTKV